MERKLVVHGVYRHFKGGAYYVEDVATDCVTGVDVVCYRSINGMGAGRLFTRPLYEFLSEVDSYKYPQYAGQYRFVLMQLPEGEEEYGK